MALSVLLRGVNIGGHRTLRPTALTEHLKHPGDVKIGAGDAITTHGGVGDVRGLEVRPTRRLMA
jgi:hypothetical protein